MTFETCASEMSLVSERQHLRQRAEIDLAVLRERQHVELDAASLPQELPRHDVGMVLELGDQDAVAPLQELAVGIGDQIDCRGAAAGEDDLHRLHAEELRDVGARVLVQLGRAFGEAMDAAQHIGAAGRLVAPHRVEHGERRLRRCAVVEIVDRPAVDDLEQDRKLVPDRGDVETHAAAFLLRLPDREHPARS